MKDAFHVVIPARMASTRLPGKPLVLLDDKTMIEHVWRRARDSGAASVTIATDSARIVDVAKEFGADVMMTRADHQSGTDRVAEVVASRGWNDELVVNVQGDEPFIPLSAIHQVVALLREAPDADMATLSTPFNDESQWQDPNCVKVLTDKNGKALLFSRASLPYPRSGEAVTLAQRHVGIYGYRSSSLQRLVAEPPCQIELAESLEQLRALWIGQSIVVAEAEDVPPPGIDTRDDWLTAKRHLASA